MERWVLVTRTRAAEPEALVAVELAPGVVAGEGVDGNPEGSAVSGVAERPGIDEDEVSASGDLEICRGGHWLFSSQGEPSRP
jgi:hypothetical protein